MIEKFEHNIKYVAIAFLYILLAIILVPLYIISMPFKILNHTHNKIREYLMIVDKKLTKDFYID